MKLIDSHCHLDFEPLPQDLAGVLQRANEAGVSKVINIGTTLLRSRKSVELAEAYPNIWASVGIHPEAAGQIADFESLISELEGLAKSDKVVAIGEIGLDYNDSHEPLTMDQKKKQRELFVAQIELAEKLDLPVIIHIRDAWEDFFEIANSKKLIAKSSVIHCFTGDEVIAKRLVGMGFCLGFTGFVTFEQSKFDHIREAAKSISIEKILVETDAPFLAPEPYRGKTNEPSYVVEVAKKVAELKGMALEEVAKTTTKNAEKLFNIG